MPTCVCRTGARAVLAIALLSVVAQALMSAPAPTPATRPPAVSRTAPPARTTPATPASRVRTRAEVEALIQQAGTTPPDWWDSVTPRYPTTLDLTWKEVQGPWNPDLNLGQFIWSIINENPGRWREGAKLLHQVLTVNKETPAKLAQTMDALARVYHNLLADWARAAFWWRKAAATDRRYADAAALDLAHCYWKLGSKDMAVAAIRDYPGDDTRHGALIKLWGEMGDLDKALALAEMKARAGYPDIGYLAAGDACRMAGRYKQAVEYYQKVIDANKGWRDVMQNRARAEASIQAIRAAEGLDVARVRDGTYTAASIAYAGPLEVAVEVKGGRILSVKVTRHEEKQYYTALADTPAQIVARQGIKGVDAVTSATITSEAIMNATVKALAQGMK